ncbi:MAG TPA: beta-ketoacyl synthase N-terminal-like domain-containing protein [Kofleriaceae bacterium]
MTAHVITGAAIANCQGTTTDDVTAGAFAARDAFSASRAFEELPFTTLLGVLPTLPDDLDFPCAQTRLASVAFASVRQLRSAAARTVARWGSMRVAYVFASSTGGLEQSERAIAPSPLRPAPAVFSYADHLMDATSDSIAHNLGASGPRIAISTACSSSFKGLATAARLIDHGIADAVIVGSADSLCRTTIYGFHSLGLLAPTATEPFSTARNGITLGEGSAYVVLERATDATRADALAQVSGIGAASDAYHHTSPHPEGLGGQLAMREALARASLAASEIDFVSAHGTGTKLNDTAEALAASRVFEGAVPMTATKSLTGHTLGSAGLTSLVLALESIRRQVIPATRLTAPVDDALGISLVTRLTEARVRHVLVNAFGFGGSNASVVLSQVAP